MSGYIDPAIIFVPSFFLNLAVFFLFVAYLIILLRLLLNEVLSANFYCEQKQLHGFVIRFYLV